MWKPRRAFQRRGVREKGCDLLGAQFGGVTQVVVADEAFDPEDVGLFGSPAVVAQARKRTHLFKQFVHKLCELPW